MNLKQGFNTKCIHAGTLTGLENPGVNTPIYYSSSMKMDFNNPSPVSYPRYLSTPNNEVVAGKMAELENAQYGYITATGMAAITAAIMAPLKSGDHAIFQKQIYGGSYNFIERELGKYGIEITWLDLCDFDKLASHIKKQTKLIYIETPSNPLLAIVDIEAVSKLAQAHKLISVIDNTFATPINQNPLDYGIDIVVHSGSKYMSGHSDLVCGAILCNSEALSKQIYSHLINHGATLDAYALYLLERSLKTMALRVERHNTNALALAQFLEEHPRVIRVNYPGLKSFAGHQIAQKQMRGFGGMMSFELDADLDQTKKIIMKLRVISSALSLGGVESLISLPRLSSHSKMTAEERKEAGIKDSLVRFSVGIEDLEDLKNDLKHSFS